MAENETKAKKLRSGDFRVTIKDEDLIWTDRKRRTIFALPWSFTKYSLTPSRLFIKRGFFTVREEEVRLYRISDISYQQNFLERIGNTGTLKIVSSDATIPEITLEHIKRARKVKDVISQAVEVSRRENGVHTSELIGGTGRPGKRPGAGAVPGDFDGDGIPDSDPTAFGPEIMADLNGNGIPDAEE